MELPDSNSEPTGLEKVLRGLVAGLLGFAALLLAFGLGFGVRELTQDDKTVVQQGGAPTQASSGGAGADTVVIDEIIGILKSQYVDRKELNESQLNTAAIDGLIASLNDRETSYISPADLKGGALSLNATYQGIGASVSDRTGEVTIVAPFRDSPAEKAGIKAGDAILEVDGEPTDGWNDQLAVEKIRGPKGTEVTLKVRHLDGTTETIKVTRGEIDIESVFNEPNLEIIPGESGKKIVDRTGAEVSDLCYVAISQFHEKTLGELRTKAKDYESKGCKGLILDLRGNPGGGLQATIDVAEEFLNSGTIITEQDGDGKKQSTSARNGGILTKLPIAVLQDQGSASGSEVLAAALRDNGRATIIGTRSFGKGTVNRLYELKSCGEPNCGALYVAIGRWLTPKGELIEGIGIEPDIEVKMTSEEYVDQGDLQIFRAIEVLRGKK